MLFCKDIEINILLNEVLFGNIEGNKASLVVLNNALLSFHTGDGGFPEIVKLEINDALMDLSTGKGQVVFEYILSYSNTCAGTRSDIFKKDRIDFSINATSNALIFSFIDLEQRSTADEF